MNLMKKNTRKTKQKRCKINRNTKIKRIFNKKKFKHRKNKKIIAKIREVNKEAIIMVDNCYGGICRRKRNNRSRSRYNSKVIDEKPRAGIATSGAYIVGKKELVEMCAERLTAPGIGKEIGPSLNQNTSLLKGLFFAPQVVASSLKTAVFASKILEELGYNVEPKYNEKKSRYSTNNPFRKQRKINKILPRNTKRLTNRQ